MQALIPSRDEASVPSKSNIASRYFIAAMGKGVASRLLLLRSFGFFDERFLPNDHHNSRIRHVESPLIGFGVKADLSALGKTDVPVDFRAQEARVATDILMIVDDGIADLAIAVHADVVPDHALLYPAAGDHRAARDDGIKRHTHPFGISKHKLCLRILVLPSS